MDPVVYVDAAPVPGQDYVYDALQAVRAMRGARELQLAHVDDETPVDLHVLPARVDVYAAREDVKLATFTARLLQWCVALERGACAQFVQRTLAVRGVLLRLAAPCRCGAVDGHCRVCTCDEGLLAALQAVGRRERVCPVTGTALEASDGTGTADLTLDRLQAFRPSTASRCAASWRAWRGSDSGPRAWPRPRAWAGPETTA